MSQFELVKFLKSMSCSQLVKLDKPELWKLIKYLQLDVSDSARKPELVKSILVTCDPESREKEHECQAKERERQEKERQTEFDE